jgi:Domain of unknown function (DUF6265)
MCSNVRPHCAFVQEWLAEDVHTPGMKTRTIALLAALPLFSTLTIPMAAEAPPARRFDWLVGRWCSQAGNRLIEEHWLPAAGDVALGIGRTLKDGKTISFEFIRIESREGVAHYVAVLSGQPATAFRLTSSGPDWARFENPQHDFPQRVEYRRTADGLLAEIAGPGKDGKETVIPLQYRRCGD